MTRRPEQRARLAVAAVFFTNGALFANVIPRYPEIRDDLGLSNATLGAALAAFPLGALTVGLFAATVVRRFGSGKVATSGVVALAAAIALIAFVPGWWMLAAVLFVGGGIDAITDVAQNAHGLRVQRVYARSIVNSFHGVWSIGAVTGGLVGSVTIALGISLEAALVGASVVCAGAALVCSRFMLGGPEDGERAERAHGRVTGSTVRLLIALGVLAACGAVVEDAGASWGAIYLHDDIGTAAAVAGLAFVALQSAMTIGRLTGDRVVDRFGQRSVVRSGGALAAVAMAVALAVPTVGTTLAGFGLAGLGVATLVPAVYHTSDEVPGLATGVGLTVMSVALRLGFLASPPLVGLTADAISLRVGLLGVVLAGTLVFWFGRVLLDHNPASATADAAAPSR
ncbi:MAG TPA: MFS transporter [Acidimicrobiales bacterium]|nr:MFS transporter [Acidimicrobiales bacterium]